MHARIAYWLFKRNAADCLDLNNAPAHAASTPYPPLPIKAWDGQELVHPLLRLKLPHRFIGFQALHRVECDFFCTFFWHSGREKDACIAKLLFSQSQHCLPFFHGRAGDKIALVVKDIGYYIDWLVWHAIEWYI